MVESDDSLQLTAYLDGELDPAETARLEACLARDPALQARAERLRRAIAAVEALPSPEASPALRRKVLAAVEPLTLLERLKASFTQPRMALAGLAAAGAAIVAVGVLTRPEDDDEDQLVLAQNLDLVEDLDVMDLDSADDVEVIASLHELEIQR